MREAKAKIAIAVFYIFKALLLTLYASLTLTVFLVLIMFVITVFMRIIGKG